VKLFGLYTDNNLATYASILDIWGNKFGFVPLNHKFPKQRLLQIIEQTGIDTVYCNKASKKAVAELGIKKFVFNDNLPYNPTIQFDNIPFHSIKTAYVLFTSGSTGEPKGIPIRFRNLEALCYDLARRFQLIPLDKVLQTFELSFDVSVACCLMAWQSNASLHLAPLNGIIPVDAIKLILEKRINVVTIAPSTVSYLKRYRILDEINLDFVTDTIFTGEALPWKYVEEWKKVAPNSTIYNAYGPTENTVWSMFYKVHSNTPNEIKNGLVPIGTPLKGFKIKMAPVDGVNNPIQGELWVRGPQVFAGYLNNKQLTRETLIKDKLGVWYKTGDLVEALPSGDFMYLSRIDQQVQVNGYRVEPGEVEHKIKTVLEIDTCAVIPIQKENEPTWLLAAIEKSDLSKEETDRLREVIPFYMMPRKFLALPQLPINSNGKIDRNKLKTEYGK